jgi:hypothetical protein
MHAVEVETSADSVLQKEDKSPRFFKVEMFRNY